MLVQGYVRVSTTQQVRDGEGLAAQQARITGWCAYQGLPAPVVASDAVSGCTIDARDGFKAALRSVLLAAERGEGAVLVTAALDRLGRNMLDALETAEVLEDAGVRLVTLDGIDTGSQVGRQSLKLLISTKAMIADIERDTIVSRLQGGRRYAREKGRVYTSEPPIGQRAEGRELVADEGEQRAIARARELHAQGLTIRAIGAALTAEGFRPRRGKAWSPAVVHKIVTGKRAPAPRKQSARVARARAVLLASETAATTTESAA
jgi:DNA invertase Pin-like site-specific DNA recombinase